MRDEDIKEIIDGMPLEHKVGQLFLLAYPGKDPEVIRPLIERYGVGGCYISQDNAATFEEAAAVTAKLQSFAAQLSHGIPMMLGVDQEGAWGVLVPESHTGPGNLALGAAGDLGLTEAMYRVLGEEMLSVGYNTLLAPCADVNLNPNSPIIGPRSFGQDPAQVAEHVYHAVRGAKTAGVLTTLKHFPGHGDTGEDTHRRLPMVDKTLEELLATSLLPFRRGIEAGADIVMTSHILFPRLDPDHPATLSRVILQDLLRDRLGFDGIILSDSMNMGAIRKNYDPAESTLMALRPGVDIVMLAEEHYAHDESYLDKQIQSLELVKQAIEQGDLPLEVVDEKLLRILRVKLNRMRVRTAPLTAKQLLRNQEIERACARRAITLVSDSRSLWPVDLSQPVVCVNATPREAYAKINNPRGIGPNQVRPAFDVFRDELQKLTDNVTFINAEELDAKLALCRESSRVLLVTEDYPLPGEDFPKEEQQRNVHKVLQKWKEKTVVIGFRSAYEFAGYPKDITYLCTFSSRACSAAEMARLLATGEAPAGKCPVTV